MSNLVVSNSTISFKAFEICAAVVNHELSVYDKIVEETVRELLDSLPTPEDWDDDWSEMNHAQEQILRHMAHTLGYEVFYPLVARATNVPAPSGTMDKEYAANNLNYLLAAYANHDYTNEPWQYRLWVCYDNGKNCPETVWHCYASYSALNNNYDAAQHSPEKIYKRRNSNHHRR